MGVTTKVGRVAKSGRRQRCDARWLYIHGMFWDSCIGFSLLFGLSCTAMYSLTLAYKWDQKPEMGAREAAGLGEFLGPSETFSLAAGQRPYGGEGFVWVRGSSG